MITAQQNSTTKPVAIVAGGAGFLGSFLCETLLFHGCRVICLDDLSTGKKENLQKVFSSPDFSFFKHNLRQPFTFQNHLAYIFDLTNSSRCSSTLLELAKKSGAKYLVVKGVSDQSPVDFRGVDGRVVFVRDVYGPRMNLERQDLVTSLFKAAVFGFPLKIPGDGSGKIYPTFVADVIYGITKAMFGAGTRGQQFVLADQQGIKVIELARKLQAQSGRSLKLEWHSKAKVSPEVVSDWHAQTPLDEGIERTLKFFGSQKSRFLASAQKIQKAAVLPERVTGVKRRPRRSNSWLFLALALLIFLSPFLFLLTDFCWAGYHFRQAQQAALRLDFAQAKSSAQRSKNSFLRLQRGLRYLAPVFELAGQQKIYQRGNRLVDLARLTTDGLIHLGRVGEQLPVLAGFILQDKPGDLKVLVDQMAADFDFAYRQFSLAQAEGEDDQQLAEVRRLIGEAKALTLLLPQLVGVDQQKTYLILLQNNHELRPTGGFIGSFALVTFNQGRLIDFEVRDVYEADGQLKGHVEPPAALKKYLGEANWWLRDANWDPDFPTSAKRIAWFLQKETGRTVNGVFGINLFVAQQILSATGEVAVPDFKEKITAANLFERAEYYAEVGFFPGSTQKQDFLASLTRQLFLQVKQGNGRLWARLGRAFYQSLQSQNLLIWLDDPDLMMVVTHLDGDGALKEIEGEGLVDYLMVVEANVGVNKANYFLRRQITHRTEIEADGLVRQKVEIDYRNHSPSESFPGGNYRNYLRILTPLGSRLEKVMIDKVAVEREKIDQGNLHGKTYFGFLVEVPVQQGRLVEISYELPTKVNLGQITPYRLLIQKQPGITDEKINLWLKTPATIRILPAGQPPATATSIMSYSPVFDKSILFEATLVRL